MIGMGLKRKFPGKKTVLKLMIWREIVGTWSEGMSIWSEGMSTWSEGMSTWSEGMSTWSEGMNTWSEGMSTVKSHTLLYDNMSYWPIEDYTSPPMKVKYNC